MPSTGSVTVSGVLVAIGRLLLQMRLVAGLGQSRNGEVDRGGPCGGAYSGCSNADLKNIHSVSNIQGLTHPAKTSATVHTVDPKCEFLQFSPR